MRDKNTVIHLSQIRFFDEDGNESKETMWTSDHFFRQTTNRFKQIFFPRNSGLLSVSSRKSSLTVLEKPN